jgi:acyl carrier protein
MPENSGMIESTVEEYLSKEVVTNPDLLPIGHDTQLIDSGILDSLSLLKLVFFLEEKFSINVGMEEVVPQNFETIDTITTFVRTKKGQPSGTP